MLHSKIELPVGRHTYWTNLRTQLYFYRATRNGATNPKEALIKNFNYGTNGKCRAKKKLFNRKITFIILHKMR